MCVPIIMRLSKEVGVYENLRMLYCSPPCLKSDVSCLSLTSPVLPRSNS